MSVRVCVSVRVYEGVCVSVCVCLCVCVCEGGVGTRDPETELPLASE